jgi:succinoglycan biosynthesis protein ExoM
VFAPVVPMLPPEAPPWIAAGRFFERPRHPTGTPVPRGELRTSNALLRRSLVTSSSVLVVEGGGPFDPRYGLSGGEDTVLFTALADHGARFVWADEAIVDERVPPERARLGFLLRRAFGGGHGHARYRLAREGSRAAPPLLARAAIAVGGAAILAPASLPLGLHRAIAWCLVGAAGCGKLAGLTPLRFEPYRARPSIPPTRSREDDPGSPKRASSSR